MGSNMAGHSKAAKNFTLISFLIEIITCIDIIPNIFSLQTHLHANYVFGNHGLGGLLKEGSHGKSPKCLGGNLGDFAKLSNR